MTTITLTFNNGPDPDVTPLVLAISARHGILSTFFVLGDKLRDRRALAERAHAEGHWIGNHTYNHFRAARSCGGARGRCFRDRAHPGTDRQSRPSTPLLPPLGNGGGVIDRSLLNEEAVEHLIGAAILACSGP